MRWGVVTFPGSNDDRDTRSALARLFDDEVVSLWHKDRDLGGSDCVVLPGGFSYGDYLRAGAIARLSPIMDAVGTHARAGGTVLGICNGFQVLCEAGLLPGAMVANRDLEFISRPVHVRVESTGGVLTANASVGDVLRIPLNSYEGNFVAPPAALDALESAGRVVLRYCDAEGNVDESSNPNGSTNAIAGIVGAAGNVAGLMPHPERASEAILGSADGRVLLESFLASLHSAAVVT